MVRPSRFVAAAVAGWYLLLGTDHARAQSAERFLIVPFENSAQDGRIQWLGEAVAILLADDLNSMGRRAYTRDERLEAFEQLQVPAVANLTRASVIRLGHLLGATHVVIGSFRVTSGQLTLRAQAIRLDGGRIEQEVLESGALDGLFAISERIGRRLARATGPAPARDRPSLQAFEDYIKGLVAATGPARTAFLEAALKRDPGFDRARLALWAVNHDEGNFQAALVMATGVPESSPLYPRARFSSALSLIQLKRLDEAFATLRALADRAPSATAMNNLGVIQMRRAVTPETGRATYYFNQAMKLDPDDPDYYFNLGYANWMDKDLQSATFWLREAVRRDPADGAAHAVLSAVLQSAGATAEASRERELASQLSSSYAEWAKSPGGQPVPQGLERVKTSLELSALRRIDNAIASVGQRDQKELTAFHLERGRRLFEQGNNTEAATELRRAVYLSPYEAGAHLLLGRIYLAAGQTQAAIDAFKIALWSRETAEGQIALAQAYVQTKDIQAARAALARALVLDPGSTAAREELAKLK
jgi:tetratricopeptide (TPR) repeat protein